jgi:hypothetical protein
MDFSLPKYPLPPRPFPHKPNAKWGYCPSFFSLLVGLGIVLEIATLICFLWWNCVASETRPASRPPPWASK